MITSVLAALVGVAAPLGLAMHLAMERAVQAEQERLRFLASYALERAQRTLVSAGDALRSFEPLDVAPCSAAHIERLRRSTITTRSVDDIGYVENGRLKCSASSMQAVPVIVTPPAFMLSNGMGVDFDLRPVVGGGRRMVGLAHGAHKALIEPVRFAYVIVDHDIQMAVALADGGVLATLLQPDPALDGSRRGGVGSSLETETRQRRLGQGPAHTGPHAPYSDSRPAAQTGACRLGRHACLRHSRPVPEVVLARVQRVFLDHSRDPGRRAVQSAQRLVFCAGGNGTTNRKRQARRAEVYCLRLG